MNLHIIWLFLMVLPAALTYDKFKNFRTRRMLLMQPHQRKNVPFVIRVPYSKIVPSNPVFSHSVAWKAKQPQLKSSKEDTEQPQQQQQPQQDQEQQQQQQQQQQEPEQQQSDLEVSQFHSQDSNGQVVFGFNSPDQMRIETRNADGTVHGTYSYLDPYGQIIKRQYWDTGAGFHVTSNTYPLDGAESDSQPSQPAVQYTPEVQAARDLHFQLYQQALASLLPSQSIHDSVQENNTLEAESIAHSSSLLPEEENKLSNDTKLSLTKSENRLLEDMESQDGDTENTLEPQVQNGSIIIQNPEYLRISWTTENKKYRLNLYNSSDSHANKTQSRHEALNERNVTKLPSQK